MKKQRNLLYIFLFLIFIICVAENCDDQKGIKQLNSVNIPEYTDSDYVKLLDNNNPEIVYNSICNLIQYADSYAGILSDSNTSDTSERKIIAKTTYNKIAACLYSRNEWVVCSSLRFFSGFAAAYKNKNEIVQLLLKVDLKTKSIRLEFINTLESLKKADLKPFDKSMDHFLKNKSWLISRYAYQLIPYTDNSSFNTYLLTKYKTAEEYDKLLIISSFQDKFNDSVLDFITSEMKSEQNKRIKLYLAKQLDKAKNMNKVVLWLNANYALINDIKEPLASYYFNKLDSSNDIRILTVLAGRNLIPESIILDTNQLILMSLFLCLNQKDNQNISLLKLLETSMLRNENFRNTWLAFKIRQEKGNYSADFIARQQKLINEFSQKAAALYDAYQIDKKLKADYIKSIENLESEFSKPGISDDL